MDQNNVTSSEGDIRISDSAAVRIGNLVKAEGGGPLMFRIAVSGGGCSGFQYGFSLDNQRRGDDRLFIHGDVTVVVDEVSLDLLRGCELEFTDDLIGSYFSIRNPNASSTCGCGTSFSV
jgi:iron-sulfur cluster insertion protein